MKDYYLKRKKKPKIDANYEYLEKACELYFK